MKNIRVLIFFVVLTGINFIPSHELFGQELPTETSLLFSGSGNCQSCHKSGTNVLTSNTGVDISPPTSWRSSMMANASKDPFWQAKVKSETMIHSDYTSVIEDKCTTCHAPMGNKEAHYNGLTYSFASMENSLLALDGISCTICHQIPQANLGTPESYTGNFTIDNSHVIYGPYESPFANPMFNQTGYTPVFSTHIDSASLCGTCHTLYTPFRDSNGQLSGAFPEQMTYFEWKNSTYNDEGKNCQSCHMPVENTSMKISVLPPFLSTTRIPVWRHDFVGANLLVPEILNTFSDETGVTAEAVHFDSTLSKADNMLTKNAVDLSADAVVQNDTLNVTVTVLNKSGHKFPTGFPSRRAWLRLIVKNSADNLIFESGNWDSNFEITGIDDDFESHYSVITSSDQVQIYQSILGDIDSAVTFSLLNAALYLKDNRLPPIGFKSTDENYDDTKIIGAAGSDPNFNYNVITGEGTGSDIITYRIPIPDDENLVSVTVELFYQTITPKFAQHLFTLSGDKINSFKTYYETTNLEPVQVSKISLPDINTGIDEPKLDKIKGFKLKQNYPNPFNTNTNISYELETASKISIKIYNILSQEIRNLVSEYSPAGTFKINWDGLNDSGNQVNSGIYILRFQAGEFFETLKMIMLK